MKHTKRKLAGLALASSLILATAASAKIAVGDYIDLSGYVGASARYEKIDRDHGRADYDSATLDLDAVKLSADIKYNALTAKISAYMPGSTIDEANSDEIFITEAYLSYNFGNGYTVSGGRFQSWIGYEPFDLDQQWNLTPGLGDLSTLVPNFHNGVRMQYTSGKITLGLAVIDSVYNFGHAYTGDADARNGLGGEFMIRYQDETFSFGTTLAVEKNDSYDPNLSRYTADFWAQYYLASTKTTFGAEFIHGRFSRKNAPSDTVDYAVMVSARQPVIERLSVAGSVAFGKKEFESVTHLRYQKVAVAPTYALSENLEARAEVSWTNYDRDSSDNRAKDRYFAGVQMVFKF
jgi:hypothetical protein